MRLTRVAFAVLAMLIFGVTAHAQDAWKIDAMNHAIEQTNFVVGDGCSGTLISVPQKLILTNFHCIESYIETIEREVADSKGFIKKSKQKRYKDVQVHKFGYQGFARVQTTSYVAMIVAEDQKRDLAVLKVQGQITQDYAAPLLPDGSAVIRGERTYTVGNPARQESTVVEGIVSNVNRTFEFSWTGGEKLPMIQFSGGIYGGNSGGALYNTHGELIGVPAAGPSGVNFIGLAIPVAEVVKPFLKDSCVSLGADADTVDAACRAAKDKDEKKD